MTHNAAFKYYMPTRVFMGKDCITQNYEIFKSLGKKALLVTGAHSAKKNGSEKDVKNALEKAGITYLVYDKVMSNPTIACVQEGVRISRENNIDFIIAIGGGSPMDAGKAIALLAVQDIPEDNLFTGPYENIVLPMVLVPTTAGTGSESTQYSILTNDRGQTKTSIATELLFPTYALLDAKYTEDLPIVTTINTAVDALSHAVESMLSVRASMISNALAAESIQMIMACVPQMLESLQSNDKTKITFDTREQLLQASTIAGMVIAQTGTTVVHSMGYNLTYFKDIDHGKTNGLLLGEYLRFVKKEKPTLVARILITMGLPDVDAFQDLMNNLLGERVEVTAEEIRQYSMITVKAKNIPNCVVIPTEEDIHEMFTRSLCK